jgi:hypothetical protein
MLSSDIVIWLKERTELSLLNEEILTAIAPHLQSLTLADQQTVV